MKSKSYIVESANWKCLVDFNDKNFTKINDKIIEICTLAFEEMFSVNISHENVEVFQLTYEDGVNYFEMVDDYDDPPDIKISLITKCYHVDDINVDKNHYYVLSDILIENSSNPDLLADFYEIKNHIFKNIPEMKKLIKNKFSNNVKIVKNIT